MGWSHNQGKLEWQNGRIGTRNKELGRYLFD
jgi:hypothetical protein